MYVYVCMFDQNYPAYVLQVTHKSGKALGMNKNWDQNLEILAFCEDIAK